MSIDNKGIKRVLQKSNKANSDTAIDQIAGAMKALAYPQRIKILQELSQRGMYFSELAELTNLKTTALNNNLNILMDAELITQEHKKGRYLATETGNKLLSALSSVLSGMSPTAVSYVNSIIGCTVCHARGNKCWMECLNLGGEKTSNVPSSVL